MTTLLCVLEDSEACCGGLWFWSWYVCEYDPYRSPEPDNPEDGLDTGCMGCCWYVMLGEGNRSVSCCGENVLCEDWKSADCDV